MSLLIEELATLLKTVSANELPSTLAGAVAVWTEETACFGTAATQVELAIQEHSGGTLIVIPSEQEEKGHIIFVSGTTLQEVIETRNLIIVEPVLSEDQVKNIPIEYPGGLPTYLKVQQFLGPAEAVGLVEINSDDLDEMAQFHDAATILRAFTMVSFLGLKPINEVLEDVETIHGSLNRLKSMR